MQSSKASVTPEILDAVQDLKSDRTSNVAAIQALKHRDNTTNFFYLAGVYAVIAITVGVSIWGFHSLTEAGYPWWYKVPVAVLAILIMGGAQHQLAGAVHEASHFMLFKHRKLNELAGDWLAAFPIYTTSYQYRVQHLAHHQFVNDPVRDPDIAQLKESDHWLDFPMPQIDLIKEIARALWPQRLIRYTLTRARYAAVGFDGHAYVDPEAKGSRWTVRLGLLFAVAVPIVSAQFSRHGYDAISVGIILLSFVGVIGYYILAPDRAFAATRLQPVISHRATAISRITYLGVLYLGAAVLHAAGYGAWNYLLLFWFIPLFTTFPLFMVLRQWVQHGNADRGRYTSSHVFLVNPLLRYCVFPWGQDYHLPHHLQASVPHFRLKKLHELMLDDPEYRAQASVLNGFTPSAAGVSILEALSPAFSRAQLAPVHVDDATLEYAELSDAAAIRRESDLSRSAG